MAALAVLAMRPTRTGEESIDSGASAVGGEHKHKVIHRHDSSAVPSFGNAILERPRTNTTDGRDAHGKRLFSGLDAEPHGNTSDPTSRPLAGGVGPEDDQGPPPTNVSPTDDVTVNNTTCGYPNGTATEGSWTKLECWDSFYLIGIAVFGILLVVLTGVGLLYTDFTSLGRGGPPRSEEQAR
ncbi:unnamed protein product [Vitrella brassicaformis CCMP3155]|uniref:Uncharacterized protein n=2 Tax=Vitrella brassicaformis TaxID=1169539 RepID=A0A0G4GQ07_VITBC|nr:unnamed protein product [Vitrella brassicaformis CCMP3155]|eukprot:CEM32453.1 unnamed protein product [Vitrella brassicaformis CCMP3155]